MAYQNGFNLKSQENLDLLDALNVISLIIGVENLKLNATSADLDKYAKLILNEIHGHLAEQDKRLDRLESEINGMLKG